ncbi:MAG: hypothetical protein ACRDTJ_08480 [Pseudonocardiaceae bacterium]
MADQATTQDGNTDAVEASGDSAEATDTARESTSAVEEVDWQAKFEAQQKINKTLESKLKKSADGDGHARAKELEAELAKLQGREAEYQAAQEAQRVKDEALAAANTRIVKAEVRAAAAGKLNDPADALAFIDLTSFEVTEDGAVDSAAMEAAVTDLISKRPYLAAQGGRFQGSADGGARNDTKKTPAELAEEAAAKGDIRASMALKADQLIELQKNN